MSALTGLPAETLQSWLTEAQGALHKLSTGAKAVTVAHDGRNVQYTPANINDLRHWISELQTALRLSSGRRPMRFVVR